MNARRSAVLSIAGVFTTLAYAVSAAAQDEFALDAARLAKAMDLAPGLSVADIGAGAGQLTVALARVVGPTGRVYATELESGRLRAIRRAAGSAGMKNVTVLEAHATRTNLPDRCCDALVLRNVYHHIDDPVLMNRSLYQSLKPGGRLAIIDFPPDSAESADPAQRSDGGQHGVTPPTVVRELRQAGFELVSVDEGTRRRGFMIVMRRPSSMPPSSSTTELRGAYPLIVIVRVSRIHPSTQAVAPAPYPRERAPAWNLPAEDARCEAR